VRRDLVKLFEYEAKAILAKNGIPTPQGGLATSVTEAVKIASKLKFPLVVKAQVLVAGRGKAGGILFAQSTKDVEKNATKILSQQIKGVTVKSIWVEEKIPIKRELYFGITTDRFEQSYVAVASAIGGMDIEEIASKTPEKVLKTQINP